ncbi:MAG: cell division protein ZapB [Bacteroides sp.]|nr:cell division protein ZapB [Prevotella sp.]MCM1408326.1 cell division protein ZapB [Treponema brennaborense]MCM1470442.1 cell division protein ZapB [Bacteroides sp.]
MITLDQIRLLEQKVESAVKKIAALEQENEQLSAKCGLLEKTNEELTKRYSSLESDQERIEQGILRALDRLNDMENTVLSAGSNAAANEPIKNPEEQNNQRNEIAANTEPNTTAAPDSFLHQAAEENDASVFDFDMESASDTPIPEEKPQQQIGQHDIF